MKSFLFLFIFSTNIYSQTILIQTILISDIDDTIKNSYVLDADSALLNISQTNNLFRGMNSLYQNFSQVFYLSSALKKVIGPFHQRFLAKHHFPLTELYLRPGIFTDSYHFKKNTIIKIIQYHKPTTLILVGDNGEHDPEVYHEIKQTYPHIKVISFIRLPYSQYGHNGNFGAPTYSGQKTFSTSIDLAFFLEEKKLLPKASLLSLLKQELQGFIYEPIDIMRGTPLFFPAWYDCRDYQPVLFQVEDNQLNRLLEQYYLKQKSRCSAIPYGS